MLKAINFNPEDIEDWKIRAAGDTSHFIVTDTLAKVMLLGTNPITVTIQDGSKLISNNKQELDRLQLPKAAQIRHVIPGMSS